MKCNKSACASDIHLWAFVFSLVMDYNTLEWRYWGVKRGPVKLDQTFWNKMFQIPKRGIFMHPRLAAYSQFWPKLCVHPHFDGYSTPSGTELRHFHKQSWVLPGDILIQQHDMTIAPVWWHSVTILAVKCITTTCIALLMNSMIFLEHRKPMMGYKLRSTSNFFHRQKKHCNVICRLNWPIGLWKMGIMGWCWCQ